MKNLTLIIAMSLGLFVLGAYANSQRPKAMYFGTSRNAKLPLFFKDNGELRCPGSNIKGSNPSVVHRKRTNLLKRFDVTVATRFQDDPSNEDYCVYFWTCNGFGPGSASNRGSCEFPQVFEPSKEKCVFYSDAKTKCNKYYASEVQGRTKYNLKKTYDEDVRETNKAKMVKDARYKEFGRKIQNQMSSKLAADNAAAHQKNVDIQRGFNVQNGRFKRRARKNFDVETDFETILDITRNADGSLSCPPVMLLDGVTLVDVFEAAREHKTLNNFNPPLFYNMKSFTHGYETRLAVIKADGKYDCTHFYQCGWQEHAFNGNQPELKTCQKNAVFQPTKIKKYRKWEVEFHGFDGFTYVPKTGRCVNNSDIVGADMDHCKGLFADGMEYWTPTRWAGGSEKILPIINDDSTDYLEEPRGDMPDYVEPDYWAVEKKEDSDNDDYLEGLLDEIQKQSDSYNEEPFTEISPKFYPEWQVVDEYPKDFVQAKISPLTPREAGLKAHREAEEKIIQAQQKIQPKLEVVGIMKHELTAEEKLKKQREDGLKLHRSAEEKILQAQRDMGVFI